MDLVMRQSLVNIVAAGALAAGIVVPMGAQDAPQPPVKKLQLAFNTDGTVTLAAQNVSLREIFAEWARRCGCYVYGAERLTAGSNPIPVQWDHASQYTVIESLLRSASGYTLTPRREGSASPSMFETILIQATTTATQSASYSTYTPPAPVAAPLTTPGSPDDELPPVQRMSPTVGPAETQIQQSPRPGQPTNAPGQPTTSPFVPISPFQNNSPPPTPPGQVTPIQPKGPGTPPLLGGTGRGGGS